MSAASYDWALKRIEELEQLIAESSPMAWVAHHDMEGAHAWEKRAADLLNNERPKDAG